MVFMFLFQQGKYSVEGTFERRVGLGDTQRCRLQPVHTGTDQL